MLCCFLQTLKQDNFENQREYQQIELTSEEERLSLHFGLQVTYILGKVFKTPRGAKYGFCDADY